MKVRALQEHKVDGKAKSVGDEYELPNAAAARAIANGLVEQVVDEPAAKAAPAAATAPKTRAKRAKGK